MKDPLSAGGEFVGAFPLYFPGGSESRVHLQFRRSLGGEDPPGGEGMATTPVFLPGESHGQRSLGAIVHGAAKSDTTEQLTLTLYQI